MALLNEATAVTTVYSQMPLQLFVTAFAKNFIFLNLHISTIAVLLIYLVLASTDRAKNNQNIK